MGRYEIVPDCPHGGEYVGCRPHPGECEKCGWNPEIERKRKNKLRGITDEEDDKGL